VLGSRRMVLVGENLFIHLSNKSRVGANRDNGRQLRGWVNA
jgi:hypothetical protein